MTYGTVGEGKSFLGELFWVPFWIIWLIIVCGFMTWTGSRLSWNIFEWDAGMFKALLMLLVNGLIVYIMLGALTRQVRFLRHWRQPLIEIGDAGLLMPWMFRGLLSWSDIASVESSAVEADAADDDAKRAMEPHLIIRLIPGSNVEHHGLPLWRARSIRFPVAHPNELAALIRQQPGYGSIR